MSERTLTIDLFACVRNLYGMGPLPGGNQVGSLVYRPARPEEEDQSKGQLCREATVFVSQEMQSLGDLGCCLQSKPWALTDDPLIYNPCIFIIYHIQGRGPYFQPQPKKRNKQGSMLEARTAVEAARMLPIRASLSRCVRNLYLWPRLPTVEWGYTV